MIKIMWAAKQLPVRVIVRLDKNIYIDPSPLIVNFSSHISVLDSKPIDDLQWDPTDYGWKLSISDSSSKLLPFFKYVVLCVGLRMKHCIMHFGNVFPQKAFGVEFLGF